MALLTIDHFAESLSICHSCTVILPQDTRGQIGMTGTTTGESRYPTLWLLHGRSDDHSIWLRRTAIERYVTPLGMAVVMPNVHLSRYSNMRYGGRYWDYVSEELPTLLERWLPIAATRDQRYVAGLSMGGWGAFKLALNQPHRFAAAASLSGALLSVAGLMAHQQDPERAGDFEAIYGDGSGIGGSEDDLVFQAARHVQEGTALPKLYACCGTEDHLLGSNRAMIPELRQLGINVTYEEGPGAHSWEFWDRWIQRAINWMDFDIPLPETGAVAS